MRTQKQFYINLVENAKAIYLNVLNSVMTNDFYSPMEKHSLTKMDENLKRLYSTSRNLKKIFKHFIYASSAIYNNTMLVDSNICYELNILTTIDKSRLYKTHKFIQFVDNKLYYACLVPGVRYNRVTTLIDNLLRGVKDATNS